MALNAGMTDLAATSHGMIKNELLANCPQNLFKHDLCHNFSANQLSPLALEKLSQERWEVFQGSRRELGGAEHNLMQAKERVVVANAHRRLAHRALLHSS